MGQLLLGETATGSVPCAGVAIKSLVGRKTGLGGWSCSMRSELHLGVSINVHRTDGSLPRSGLTTVSGTRLNRRLIASNTICDEFGATPAISFALCSARAKAIAYKKRGGRSPFSVQARREMVNLWVFFLLRDPVILVVRELRELGNVLEFWNKLPRRSLRLVGLEPKASTFLQC